MAAARRKVFVGKVLKRLFPHDPHGQEKRAPLPAACETPPEKERCRSVGPLGGGGTETRPSRRLYTVALPPEGYVPAPPVPALPEPEPEAGPLSRDSEGSSSRDDKDVADQDPYDQPKRRRIRKHKSKKKFKSSSNVHVGQVQLEKHPSLLEEKTQPQHTDGPTISRNKKRKLKKKQQMKRKRAAGLLTKASGVSFLYAPEEGGSEPGEDSEGARGDSSATEEDRGNAGDCEDGMDAGQGGDKGSDDRADGILEFLKSTQEMYFYDGVSKDSDPAFLEAAEGLLTSLEAHHVSPSDLLALDHMKALLLLQDPGGLRRALQVFEEHCTLPPGHTRVVSAFFNYWITHVLPEKTVNEIGTPTKKS